MKTMSINTHTSTGSHINIHKTGIHKRLLLWDSLIVLIWGFVFGLAMFPGLALAGTGGTEFTTAYQTVTGWLNGDLGRLIAVGLLIVGLAMGIVRQSIAAAVPAIGAALVVQVAPTIIGAVVTATI